MDVLSLLKKIPSEHYTDHKGVTLKVSELIQILEIENDKYSNGDVPRQNVKGRLSKVNGVRKK